MKRSILTFVILVCILHTTANSYAASAHKVTDYSLPKGSGPGIVICDSVPAPASSDLSHFSSGCALWLQFYLGGQPELGKSPTWEGTSRIYAELHRDDLQLSIAQPASLTRILGVTHAAVGTLRGTDSHLTLTYKLLQEPSGKIVGLPITVTGTEMQITAKLPLIARTLAARLGVSHPDIPTTTGLTQSELLLLEKILRSSYTDVAATDRVTFDVLANRNPFADIITLGSKPQTNAQQNTTVTTLLQLAGTNTLAWCYAATINPMTIVPHIDALRTLTTRYPTNANLAVAETYYYRYVMDRQAERKAASRIVHDAPNNPDGWLTYAYTLREISQDMRQGRVYQSLTAAEADQLNQIYPEWEEATRHAVQLDPLNGKAWFRLAEAATFNGDPTVADHAMQNTLKYYDDKPDAYGWALEMYQPKWNDDPVMLAKIAKIAAADTTLNAQYCTYIREHLVSSGNNELAKKVITDFFVRRRAFIAAHPNDGEAHWGLAYVLDQTGDLKGAIEEYRKASALLPDNPVIHYDLGYALYGPGRYDEAGKEYQEAIRLDPDYADAHTQLGYLFKHLGKFDDAKREIATAMRLNPGDGSSYAVLGDIDTLQGKFTDAVTNYQTAIRYGAYQIQTYDNLLWCMDSAKQYDQTIAAGEAALRVYPNADLAILTSMADAYLNTKQWDKSIKVSQTSLAENPNEAITYENLGEAYLGKGDKAEARQQWQKVLTLNDEAMKAEAQKFLDQNP